jgi:hypothetical protein
MSKKVRDTYLWKNNPALGYLNVEAGTFSFINGKITT